MTGSESRREYLRHINKVQDYIEANLGSALALEERCTKSAPDRRGYYET